jgi:hypothetical protein
MPPKSSQKPRIHTRPFKVPTTNLIPLELPYAYKPPLTKKEYKVKYDKNGDVILGPKNLYSGPS